jgi:hypothetical protein
MDVSTLRRGEREGRYLLCWIPYKKLTSITRDITTAKEVPDTRLSRREVTGKYAVKNMIKHAQTHLPNKPTP